MGEFVAEGYGALLVAFAVHAYLAACVVDGVVVERGELGEAHACLVEGEHDGVLELRLVGVGLLCVVEQPVHLFFAHELRQGPVGLGAVDDVRRVVLYVSSCEEVAVVGFQGAQASGYGCGAVALVELVLHPVAHDVGVYRGEREFAVETAEKLLERFEVAAVAFHCILRPVALVAQIVEKAVNTFLHVLFCFSLRIYDEYLSFASFRLSFFVFSRF